MTKSWDDSNVILEIRDAKTNKKLTEGNYQTICNYIKEQHRINERQTNNRLFSENLGYLAPEPPIDY